MDSPPADLIDEDACYDRIVQALHPHPGPKSTRAVVVDGDGGREVHCDTQEGLWTGVRNLPRPSHGGGMWYEPQFIEII